MKNIDLFIGQCIRYSLSILGVIIFYSCAVNTDQSYYEFEPYKPPPPPSPKALKDYQIFFNVIPKL